MPSYIEGTARTLSFILHFIQYLPLEFTLHHASSVLTMTTSKGQSSKIQSEVCTFDRNTLYAFPPTDPLKFDPKFSGSPTEEETALSNIELWAPPVFKHRPNFRLIEDGTATRLTEIGRSAINVMKSRQDWEARREQKQHDEPLPDLNESLLSAFSKITSTKSRANTYDVKVLFGAPPSRTEFERHGFVRVNERQFGDLVYGCEEEMREKEAEQTAFTVKIPKVGIVGEGED
jgi:hypothetical protein